MSVNITYKNNTLTSFSSGTKILKTAGKYMEDDVTINASASGVDLPVFTMVFDANEQVLSLTCNKTYAECYELINDQYASSPYTFRYYAILNMDYTASGSSTYCNGMSGYQDYNTSGTPLKYYVQGEHGRPIWIIWLYSDETITYSVSDIAETLTATQNKTYNAPYPKLYSQVNVNVPNTYVASDEGKVVSNGALVAQTSDTVTTNNTYDTTLINSLTVNVSGGGGFGADDIANGTAPNGAITLSSAVTTVEKFAFFAKPITSVSGSAVTRVKDSAFMNCSSMTSATFPALTTIESNAFKGSKLTSASFPLVTSVGGTAFEACQSLTSISLPAVTTPSNFAYNCQNLTSVDLSACTTVAGGTFQQCYKLATLDLPACTKIQNNAFYNARILSTLILRNSSVVTLDNVGAFTNTPMRGYNSLSGTIYVPSALVSSYQTATNWSTMYSGGHCTFAAIEGSQYE